jgi:glycosyltransferase involved in cell wall biosynthesis
MASKKDILFYAILRPKRSPSQRYRIEQFFEAVEKEGFTYQYRYLLNEHQDNVLYSKGHYFEKILVVLSCIYQLTRDGFFLVHQFKYVFIQRELIMLGTSFFEKWYAKKAVMIYDFDDAIWLPNISEANKKLAFLKYPEKVNESIAHAQKVIAGNDFLKNHALQFNRNVSVIPTVLDTSHYKRKLPYAEKQNKRVCIGWSGSHTTIEHFKIALPFLYKLKEKYGDKIYFKIVGDQNFEDKTLGIKGVKWTFDTEINELEEIDIGIMPLPQDSWSEGKCGLKGLVYMAMGIPSVMSNVGVNATIIQHGTNGYLVDKQQDWISTLSLLIDNPILRIQVGTKGRETIEESYSVDVYKKSFVNLFR